MVDRRVKGIRIRPDQRGLRSLLFDLEADIMEVVWAGGWHEFCVADVHRALQQRREIAYTTVMTTVVRLFRKGVLDRRKVGTRYVYVPRTSRDGLQQLLARELMDGFSKASREEAIALLVERVSEADAEELRHLEDLIRKRRKELGR